MAGAANMLPAARTKPARIFFIFFEPPALGIGKGRAKLEIVQNHGIYAELELWRESARPSFTAQRLFSANPKAWAIIS
jgi:hypothetical protein